MSPPRLWAGRARAARAVVALAAISASFGAVAFAATRPGGGEAGLGGNKQVAVAPSQGGSVPGAQAPKGEEQLPRARFLESPQPLSTLDEPQFRFHVAPRSPGTGPAPVGPVGEVAPTRRFQCRLDGADWNVCGSPYRLTDLALGAHSVAVRALSRSGRPGPAVAYSWRQVERQAPPPKERLDARETADEVDPMPFSIESRGEAVDDLLPGYPAEELPVLISNPNAVPIEVTSVVAAISPESPDCPAENFALAPSSVSDSAPVSVPAGASVALPSDTASAPSITMLNLPVNQDSCRGVEIQLAFSGEAHG